MASWGTSSNDKVISTAGEGAADVKTTGVTADTAKNTQQYLSDYNTNREQKIRDMYSGSLGSVKAQQNTAYNANTNAYKTAYDQNLGNLKTAYDNNTASLKTAYDKNLGTLKTAYDKNAAAIANAYEQNLSDAEAARAKISPQYQDSMNALAAEYERQRRNNNMQGAANGLNTGAGSQLALGQSMSYQRNQGNLARSENEALTEAERDINDLGRNYRNNANILEQEYNNNQAILDAEYANNSDRLAREYQNNQNTYATTYNNNMATLQQNYQDKVAEAVANNDYQLAAALLDEYGAQYDRTMSQASQLAEFGDFSLYANIYGVDAAQQMEKNWSLQNPDLAYNLGKITADDYYTMTGKYPRGYSASGIGGGWGSYSGRGGTRGGGGDRGYYGPAGHYDYYGNFVVDSTGAKYGSMTNLEGAGTGTHAEVQNLTAPTNILQNYKASRY